MIGPNDDNGDGTTMTDAKITAPAAPKPKAKPAAKVAGSSPVKRGPAPAASAAKAAVAKPAVKAAVARVATPKAAVKAPANPVAKPKPAPRAKPAPEATVATTAAAFVGAVSDALSIRKKELVDRVVAASGAKKKQVKEIVEHTLKVLGDALAKGEQLNLPPFGKAKVNRSRDTEGGTMMMVKLKQGGDQAEARKAARKTAKQGLADPED